MRCSFKCDASGPQRAVDFRKHKKIKTLTPGPAIRLNTRVRPFGENAVDLASQPTGGEVSLVFARVSRTK